MARRSEAVASETRGGGVASSLGAYADGKHSEVGKPQMTAELQVTVVPKEGWSHPPGVRQPAGLLDSLLPALMIPLLSRHPAPSSALLPPRRARGPAAHALQRPSPRRQHPSSYPPCQPPSRLLQAPGPFHPQPPPMAWPTPASLTAPR